MEITRDAVLRVVKAARMAGRLDKDLFAVLMLYGRGTGESVLDEINGNLFDAIFFMIGEQLMPEQDFEKDSVTMKLLRSELSDEELTEEIIRMAEKNAPKQPKPNLISRDAFNEMVGRCGGYRAGTPEGEWPK